MIKKSFLPNFLTLMNLLSGVLSVLVSLRYDDKLWLAGLLIIIGSVFDFFDGFVARKLGVSGELGKNLDSLSDVVSFGVAPGFIVFALLAKAEVPNYLAYTGFLIPLFSALRLAKFNVDTEQKYYFKGLPTPAMALFFVGLAMSYSFEKHTFFLNDYFVVLMAVIMSVLMVSNVPMFSLKFGNFSFRDNKLRYIFLVISFVLILVFRFLGLSLVIVFYVVLSLIFRNMVKE